MLGTTAGVRAGIANVSRAVAGRTGIGALAVVTALEGAAAASDPGGLQVREIVFLCHQSIC